MSASVPTKMQAIAIDQYGGPDLMKLRTVAVPGVDAGEVLIRVQFAGVGVWDPAECAGAFAELAEQINGRKPSFPHVIGSEGAGTVLAVGAGVTHVKVGDRVYAATFLNAKGGFYAEYAVANASVVSRIPGSLPLDQAAAMGGDAGTALRGLEDVLHVTAGESVLIFGAGGGLGHFAVQLAKRLGTRVFAVASGEDGVALAKRLGADVAVNGRKQDIAAAARAFAPDGIDAALLTASGEAAERALTAVKPSGRIAYPNGVEPAPKAPDGLNATVFDGNVDAPLLTKLNALIEAGPFEAKLGGTFTLERAVEAHQALGTHYLGKLVLRIA